MKKIFCTLYFLFFVTLSFCQNYNYELKTLQNGLKVITLQDNSAPAVSVMMWYKVGSRNEHTGKTGISHLLEHMLFKSTKKFKADEVEKLIQKYGGHTNGFTSRDYTAYYITIPSNKIELALQIESDRMKNALFLEQELKLEKNVVISELEGKENSPEYLLDREINLTAFSIHPYRNPIIGYIPDVLNIERDDLIEYYNTYYQPKNATLVIVGDVNKNQIQKLVNKYFGNIKNKRKIPEIKIIEPQQRGEKRIKIRREGNASYFQAAFHIPQIGNSDIYALDVINQVLSEGKSSRLYKKLILGNLCVDFNVSNFDSISPSLFKIEAEIREDVKIEDVEKAIFDEIENIKRQGISESELKRAISQIETNFIYSLDSNFSLAYQLGFYETIYTSSYVNTYIENIKKLTIEDIRKVAEKYFTKDNSCVGIFIPTKKTETPTQGENKEFYYKNNKEIKNTKPKIRREILKCGLTVIVLENKVNPLIAISGKILAGSVFEKKEKKYLSNAVAYLITSGTKNKTQDEIFETLDNLGVQISFSQSRETIDFSMKCKSSDFKIVFEILFDILKNPIFPDEELQRYKKIMKTRINQIKDNPAQLAHYLFYQLAYPEGHSFHNLNFTDLENIIDNITRDDLIEFYNKHFIPSSMILSFVGDVNSDEVVNLLNMQFENYEYKEKVNIPDIESVPVDYSAKTEDIKMKDKSQTFVIAGHPVDIKRDNPDFYAVRIANYILADASLISRLYKKLREEKGYVYFVDGDFQTGKTSGPYLFTFGCSPKDKHDAIKLLKEEIEKMQTQGITEQELKDAVSYITGSFVLRLETNDRIANILTLCEYFNLGVDYPWNILEYYNKVKTKDIQTVLKKYIHPDKFTIISVGP